MKNLLLISFVLLSGCATQAGYFNHAAIGAAYCDGDVYLTCEWRQ